MVSFSAGKVEAAGLSKGEISMASLSAQYTLFSGVKTGPPMASVPTRLLAGFSGHNHLDVCAQRFQENVFVQVCVLFYVSFLCPIPSHHISFIFAVSPHWGTLSRLALRSYLSITVYSHQVYCLFIPVLPLP